MTAANVVTLLRLLLALVCLALLPGGRFPVLVLVLFVTAAATDWLDGYLARRLKGESAFGRIADPFVDKILVCGGFILLLGDAGFCRTVGLAPWMVATIVGREFLVSGLRGFLEGAGIPFGANRWGKTKLLLQAVAFGFLLGMRGKIVAGEMFLRATHGLLLAAVAVTVVSCVPYLTRAVALLSRRPPEEG